ncbi:TIGR03621 family F420-dependent LLM class oxidoreductase [Streptomyces spiralis]|uniref:TIGR03621 family F420-dependent LLM class oxidoreductase n=1 Tax=Streptomyces spiralis TaxID=66376 RepID=UPI0033D3E365
MSDSVRFGVTIAPDTSARRWRDMVRALEDSPVDVLLVNDHLSGLRYAPLTALSVAAALTSRIRLGTVVLANDYRHPAVLAKEIATLDLLSEGRVEVGIGSGWMRTDYEQAGLPFDIPKVRVRRLREAVRYLRGAWADEPFDFDGEYYQAAGLDLDPRPVQRPHPPLMLGGGGPVMLRFAAQEADIINITNRTAADGRGVDPADVGIGPLRAKVDLLREAAAARWPALELSVSVRAAAVDRPISRLHPAVAAQVDSLRGTPFLLEGSVAQVTEQVLRWHDELGISYFVLGNTEDAASMFPVMERVKTALSHEITPQESTHA